MLLMHSVSFSRGYERQSGQNAGFENASDRNRLQGIGQLRDQRMDAEARNEHSIKWRGTKAGHEPGIVGDGFNAGFYALFVVDACRSLLRGCVCADGYGLGGVSLVFWWMSYGLYGLAVGITGWRAAIVLAADSMVLVMAREEFGLRRRMLMLEELERDMAKGDAKKKRTEVMAG